MDEINLIGVASVYAYAFFAGIALAMIVIVFSIAVRRRRGGAYKVPS